MNAWKHEKLIAIAIWLLGCITIFAFILHLNEGRFIYTLDDPYIHLAVAEEIARGSYGVNPDEFTAPASSILWPFILAPLALTPVGEYLPLVINLTCGVLTLLVLMHRLRNLLPDSDATGHGRSLLRLTCALSVMLCANSIALVFSGMEHNLQFLLIVCTIDALLAGLRKESIHWWHYASLAIAPLIRYENLAFVGPVGLYLFIFCSKKPVMIAGLIAAGGIAAFSYFIYQGNGSPLPNSIMAKALMDDSGPPPSAGIGARLIHAMSNNRSCTLAILIIAALPIAFLNSSKARFKVAVAAIALAGTLHLFFGPFGWYNRYEAYVIGGTTFGLIALALHLTNRLSNRICHLLVIAGIFLTIFIAKPYLTDLSSVPRAANNIHRQQFQMHRFLVDHWKNPVAVNDLGWTSFRNEEKVLDLWGLASRQALQARLDGLGPEWMETLAIENDSRLIMIYESWFPDRPESWIKIAELTFSAPRITPAGSMVTFYAINPEAADELEPLLEAFRQTLPSGASMRLRGEKPLEQPLWLDEKLAEKMVF